MIRIVVLLVACSIAGCTPIAGVERTPQTIESGSEKLWEGRLAASNMATGMHHYSRGQLEAALSEWADAARRFAAEGDKAGYCHAQLRTGAAYLTLGRHRDGIEVLKKSLSLAKEIGDPALIAEATSSLGNAYLRAGRLHESAALLEAGFEASTAAHTPRVASLARNDLGNLRALEGDFDAAVEHFRRAIALAREIEDQPLSIRASINLVRALLEAGRQQESAGILEQAVENARAIAPSRNKAYALIGAGRLVQQRYSDAQKQAYAVQILNEAAAVAEAIDDSRALSYALGYLGQSYEQSRRHDDALLLTRRAAFAAQQANAQESLYLWHWQAGRLLKTQGNVEEAILAYQRAVHALQAVRPGLSSRSLVARHPFREQFGPLFLELADLLLRRSTSAATQKEAQAYYREARVTVEALKGAELEDYFQDDCVAALKERSRGIDQLAANTAALYAIVLDDRLELLLSLPAGIKRFTAQVTSAALKRRIRELRKTLENPTSLAYLPHAQQLYKWLIDPLETALRNHSIDTLVILPDGPLRTVPFGTLHDGRRFLIERYALATTPGLTLTDPRPIKRVDGQLLTGGLTASVQGFPALPNVADEINSVVRLYGGEVLLNDDFVTSKLEHALENLAYSIVHIASHAKFSGSVEDSFLLTYDGRLRVDDLENLIGMTKYRDSPVEILTLSACRTAVGDDQAALGLAGIAVKSGARSALATLWFIEDQSTGILVSEFYRQLKHAAVSKAKALQRAQLKLLNHPHFGHPAFWSPFLLIGNWL